MPLVTVIAVDNSHVLLGQNLGAWEKCLAAFPEMFWWIKINQASLQFPGWAGGYEKRYWFQSEARAFLPLTSDICQSLLQPVLHWGRLETERLLTLWLSESFTPSRCEVKSTCAGELFAVKHCVRQACSAFASSRCHSFMHEYEKCKRLKRKQIWDLMEN